MSVGLINYKLIGNRIKCRRLERNLTQEKLSELLDISPEYISKIETGKVEVNLKRIAQICLTLDCGLEYLLSDTLIEFKGQEINDVDERIEKCTDEEKEIIYKILKLVDTL